MRAHRRRLSWQRLNSKSEKRWGRVIEGMVSRDTRLRSRSGTMNDVHAEYEEATDGRARQVWRNWARSSISRRRAALAPLPWSASSVCMMICKRRCDTLQTMLRRFKPNFWSGDWQRGEEGSDWAWRRVRCSSRRTSAQSTQDLSRRGREMRSASVSR